MKNVHIQPILLDLLEPKNSGLSKFSICRSCLKCISCSSFTGYAYIEDMISQTRAIDDCIFLVDWILR